MRSTDKYDEVYDYERRCSACKHSVFDESRPNIVPSIHICYNKKSKYYEWPQAWSCTCDKFVIKDEED